MGAITLVRELSESPEILFDTITRPGTWQHWLGMHHGFIGEPPQHLRPHSTFVSEIVLHGMTEEIEWTVAALTPTSWLMLRGTGRVGAHCRVTYGLQATPTGTTITASVTFSGPLITKTVAKALTRYTRPQLSRALSQLGELASVLPGPSASTAPLAARSAGAQQLSRV